MAILVPKRENDQYREGHVVNISRTGSITYPVGMMERFISKAHIKDDSHLVGWCDQKVASGLVPLTFLVRGPLGSLRLEL